MASNGVKTLDDSNFDEVLAGSEGPVLVEFTATWCGPCRVQAGVLERVACQNTELCIGAVDVDAYPELAARYGVRGVPTLIVFRGGKEAGRRLGLANDAAVGALLGGTSAAPRAAEKQPVARV